MAIRQIVNYDDNGIVSIEDIEVPDVDINVEIQQKEELLLSMYEELERLKALRNQ